MFLIDFFFRDGRRRLQSKYVLKVAPTRWLSRCGRWRTLGRFVCLFSSSAFRLPSSSCEQAETRLQLCIQCCRGCSKFRPSAAPCSEVLSCVSWLQGGEARVSKSRPADRTGAVRVSFFLLFIFVACQRSKSRVCACCF